MNRFKIFSQLLISPGKLSHPSHLMMVGGTQSCLHHPAVFQALHVAGAAVVAVPVSVAAAVADVGVVVHEMVHHCAYVAPATTAMLEQAPWIDNGH